MRPVIILGGGGHARVVLDALLESGRPVIGYTTANEGEPSEQPAIYGVPFHGDDASVFQHHPSNVELVNGLGSTSPFSRRVQAYRGFRDAGYTFSSVLHPSAVISQRSWQKDGIQVMAGAVVQANTSLGANVIVNTRASVDHDCIIGDHVHIAPGATLSGGVHVGEGSHIGTGAVVIQGIHIGAGCLIAAGAVVVRDVPDGAVIMGVPGKERFR